MLAMAALQPALAAEAGDWMIRLRAINVNPNDDSSAVTGIAGSEVSVDDDTVPELDISYMFTDNFGLELILATSTHRVSGEGAIAGLGEIVETEVLPPTLNAQWHFNAGDTFMPYVGGGINFTVFYDEEAKTSLNDALGTTRVSADESFGLSAQVGTDIRINDRWFANFDVKLVQIETEAELRSTVDDVTTVRTVDIDINPFIFGVGIGVRF
jgi:outer membrane protein